MDVIDYEIETLKVVTCWWIWGV